VHSYHHNSFILNYHPSLLISILPSLLTLLPVTSQLQSLHHSFLRFTLSSLLSPYSLFSSPHRQLLLLFSLLVLLHYHDHDFYCYSTHIITGPPTPLPLYLLLFPLSFLVLLLHLLLSSPPSSFYRQVRASGLLRPELEEPLPTRYPTLLH
jgi:hypothetical protein